MSQQYQIQFLSDWSVVINALKPHLKSKTVVLLDGNLGAGKTTFVGLVAKEFGINAVSSPTFALIQNYSTQDIELVHVDLYRLENSDEIEATGFWELFDKPNRIIFVEWSSKVSDDHWPLSWTKIKLKIEKKSEQVREVTVTI